MSTYVHRYGNSAKMCLLLQVELCVWAKLICGRGLLLLQVCTSSLYACNSCPCAGLLHYSEEPGKIKTIKARCSEYSLCSMTTSGGFLYAYVNMVKLLTTYLENAWEVELFTLGSNCFMHPPIYTLWNVLSFIGPFTLVGQLDLSPAVWWVVEKRIVLHFVAFMVAMT